MKSSVSNLTDSIENQSLPSIPTQRKSPDIPTTSQLDTEDDVHLIKSQHNKTFSLSKIFCYQKSNTVGKQSKMPELNKINEYDILKVFEHRNFGKSPSNYSRLSEEFSALNLPTSSSFIQHKIRLTTPSLRTHYCKFESPDEGFGRRGPKGYIYLPKLRQDEIQFLQLVAENNVALVQQYLEQHQSLNINCVNFQGISALHIAVHNRSEEMVEFLLRTPQVEIGDTVLHAIRDNSTKILVTLLDAQKKNSPGLEFAGNPHSTIFPAHVTPLILAAQLNHYEIVNLLLNRGHKVTRPHSPNCPCTVCKNSIVNDDALHSSCARLSVYRAISSPAYLIHHTSDPILEAFYLTEELAANAAAYRHLAVEYMRLRNDVSSFAVDLIGCCRSSDEVEVILKQTSGCEYRHHFVLPRLLMALNYRQKEFVAHPHTQQVLESYWLGEWHIWRNKSMFSKAMIVLFRIFIIPLILLLCMILPRHSLLKHYQIPLNKLISHMAAYIVFLGLVFHISNQDKSHQKRGPSNTGAEAPLVLYVIGYTWSAIRMCFMQGPRRYFNAMWNWAEIIMLTLFWLTFMFWIMAAIDDMTKDENLERNLTRVTYLPFSERKYWNQYDPILLAEGTFCLATIFAFFRLMFLCQLNYHLGPLQVSLGKMTMDIYKYILVFAIIICSFAAGLSRFYQYYNGMVYEDEFGMKTVQVSSFTSLRDTLNTLFWALFCMSPLESADIVLENTKNPTKDFNARENKHEFTERIGYFCFGCFEVISVIVVLNMLIATMSNTFQRVTDNVAIEWTFGKTEVYINYMWQTTVPPPFNLVPTATGMTSMIEWLRIKLFRCRGFTGVRARWSPAFCCFIERDMDTKIQREYPALISVLVQRYYSKINRTNDNYLKFIRHEIDCLQCRSSIIKT